VGCPSEQSAYKCRVGCARTISSGVWVGSVDLERFERRLASGHPEIQEWIGDLPGPVMVTYEAGPTGFRACAVPAGAGIDCSVAAPLKLQRPSGDRVETDRPAPGPDAHSSGDRKEQPRIWTLLSFGVWLCELVSRLFRNGVILRPAIRRASRGAGVTGRPSSRSAIEPRSIVTL
jgi:hypothetical protein